MTTIRELEKDAIPEVVALILVCRIFLKTATDEELDAFLASHGMDWELFYKVACAHQIRPVVNKVFTNKKINEIIGNRLQSDCLQINFRNLEHYRELLRLNGLFQKAGVTAVPYKGCLFALQFYNDISLREFSDLDFLIYPDKNELEQISRIMTGTGYTIAFEAPDKFQEFYFSHIREFKFFIRTDNKRKFLAEFHSSLNDPVFETATPIANEYLFTDMKEETLSGGNIRLLSPARHFIAMLTHHGIREQWTSLKNIMDMAVAMQSGNLTDWDFIFECGKIHNYSTVLGTGLTITDDLLGVSLGKPFNKVKHVTPWLQRLFSKHLHKTDRTWRNNFVLKLRSKDTVADKYRLLWQHVRYLATPSILDYKFIQLPRSLFFLYVFIKPVRMLSNKRQSTR